MAEVNQNQMNSANERAQALISQFSRMSGFGTAEAQYQTRFSDEVRANNQKWFGDAGKALSIAVLLAPEKDVERAYRDGSQVLDKKVQDARDLAIEHLRASGIDRDPALEAAHLIAAVTKFRQQMKEFEGRTA